MSQKPRHHATRPIPFTENNLEQIGANGTREIIVAVAGFAALYADIVCGEALDVTIEAAHTLDGPWVELDTFTSSGDPADPNPIAVGCKRGYVKLTLANGGTPTTNFAIVGTLHTAVLS